MRKLRIITAALAGLVLLLTFAHAERLAGQTVWGSRGLAVSLSEWSYTLDVAGAVWQHFYDLSDGPNDVWYESSGLFTRDRLRDQLRQFDMFYANTHGEVGVFETGDHKLVFASDIAQWVDRPFTLVFLDGCRNAGDASLAEAFGIHAGDSGRAFFGWVGDSQDSWYYRMFTLTVFEQMGQGETLESGVLMANAYWPSNVPWRIYGDRDLSFRSWAAEATPTWTLTPTASSTPTPTHSPTPSLTASATPSPTATETPSPTLTKTPNPAVTLTAIAHSTITPGPTFTSTPISSARSYLPVVVR